MTPFEQRLAQFQSEFDPLLAGEIPATGTRTVEQAARYSLIAGGKRLRPFLVKAAARACGILDDRWVWPAIAVEMVHTYSLIHDDLPAMDDDDLRRGKPTCHKVYSEALAILAGDGLQVQALDKLLAAPERQLNAGQKLKMIGCLTRASGFSGMVGGQALDIAAEGKVVSVQDLEEIHAMKTGALITAAIEMGCLCQPELSDGQLSQARIFGQTLGLAFQVVDDILDVNGDTQTLGKTRGSDIEHDKATFPALLGLEGAKAYASALYQSSLEQLANWQADTRELQDIASFVLLRNR